MAHPGRSQRVEGGRETCAGTQLCSLYILDLEREEHPGPWQVRAELGPREKGPGLVTAAASGRD